MRQRPPEEVAHRQGVLSCDLDRANIPVGEELAALVPMPMCAHPLITRTATPEMRAHVAVEGRRFWSWRTCQRRPKPIWSTCQAQRACHVLPSGSMYRPASAKQGARVSSPTCARHTPARLLIIDNSRAARRTARPRAARRIACQPHTLAPLTAPAACVAASPCSPCFPTKCSAAHCAVLYCADSTRHRLQALTCRFWTTRRCRRALALPPRAWLSSGHNVSRAAKHCL